MNVVLDTNVVVSSLLSASGAPAELIKLWEAERFEVVVLPQLLDELRRVLRYPQVAKYLRMGDAIINDFQRRYATFAIHVEPQIRLEMIAADPADNRVLECAVTANVSFIVTGDRHLLELKEFRGIVILSPSSFLSLLKS